MIEHIVLFRWKEGTSPDAIHHALEELRKLREKIPGILDLACGTNFSDRAKGYTHALVVRFSDRAALDTYSPHPEHQRVVQNLILPIRDDVLGFDFEL